MWARAVQKDAHSYYQAAMRAAWTDRAIDHGEDWSPDEGDLEVALEEVWIRGYRLVMGNYQMERWLQLWRKLNDKTAEPARYRELRNALEHLDEASFSGDLVARRAPTGKAWSLDDLPDRELSLGFHNLHVDNAFGIADLKELTDAARIYASFGRGFNDDYEPSSENLEWLRQSDDDCPD